MNNTNDHDTVFVEILPWQIYLEMLKATIYYHYDMYGNANKAINNSQNKVLLTLTASDKVTGSFHGVSSTSN